jgi:hypothetical protein
VVTDSVLTPDGTSLHLTYTPAATCILIAGYLGLSVIERLDEILETLPGKAGPPVLIRISSTVLEFGASEALRRILSMRRGLGLRLAVWADEPLVRRTIPMSLLHATPPYGGATWNDAVPAPP